MVRRVSFCVQGAVALVTLILVPSGVFATIENETYDQRVTATGGSGDQFGESIVNVGDVNGDGYHDLLVSHPVDDTGASNAGAAHMYYGNATGVSSTPDLSFYGTVVNQVFSYGNGNLAEGDVNNDGYNDVIIGTYRGSASGAKVYFGGPSMDTTADVTISNGFGAYSLFAAHDINGDGYDDVVAGDSDGAKVKVYFGGASMNTTADISFTGTAGTSFGNTVAPAGDVNGDGVTDWIFSANGDGTVGVNAGAAFIYYGSATTIETTADVTLLGLFAGDQFGIIATRAGDVNNDGFDDVLVGASSNDDNAADSGAAYMFYGGAAMDDVADITFRGVEASDAMGESIAAAGDVNGDGYDDVFIMSNGATFNGRPSLFYGGAAMDTTADLTLSGENGSDFFGGYWLKSISVGDINNDDAIDWIFAAPGYASGAFDGAFYVYLGTPPASSSSSSSSSVAQQRGGAAGGAGPGGRTAKAADLRRAIMLTRFRGLLGSSASSRAFSASSRSASLSSTPLRCSRIQSVLRRNRCARMYLRTHRL